MNNLPTPRPYNSYNLFFQIEREFILQTLPGYQPTTASKDVFDPTDETYPADGPPLPSRYKNLILPYDWHIPGKGLRRKRSHRKSHGKIGFHQLSERISKSWSVADDDVRNFCARLADIQTRKYKETKRKATKKEAAQKRIETKTIVTKTTEKSDPKNDDCKDDFPSFDWTSFSNVNQGPAMDRRLLDDSTSNMCHIDTFNSDDTEHNYSYNSTAGHRRTLTEVDMADEEIIDLFLNSPTDDEGQIEGDVVHSSISRPLPLTRNHTTTSTPQEKEIERIDTEYEMFKELGKQLLTRQKLPSKLKQRGFTACQA